MTGGGQLLTKKVQLNDSPEASVAYTYDPLGRCTKTVVGEKTLSTDFTYDISGNLKSQTNEVLQLHLYRERPSAPSVAPNFAGMISECRWMHRKNVSEGWHSYQYAYTPYGEFQEVQLQHGPAMQPRNVEKNLTYDWNGNIITLQRTGIDSTLIADYTYHYTGSRLDSLCNAAKPVRTFSYDRNGNMISDSQTGCKFQYNILNLTEKVSDAASQELVRYTWLFDGTKFRTRTSDGNGYTYLGSLIYADSPAGTVLESTYFSHGRILRTSNGYALQYHVRDHLGSVRSIVDEEGEVVEVNDYYPFGQRWDKPAAPRTDNRYRFNGKESQTFADLPLLDYGARMYDSDLGRWQVHDPKAADYYPTSPYAFCAGNPINLVDPNGEDAYYYNVVTGERKWVADTGGADFQYVYFVQPGKEGGFQEIGSGCIAGKEVYIGPTRNGWAISNVNYWQDLPTDLAGYKGYTYDMDDLRMRHYIRNSDSRVLKQALMNLEQEGLAEPLTGTNYWDTYGQTKGNLFLIDEFFNMAMFFTPSLGSLSTGKRFSIKSMINNHSTSGSGPSIAEFNQFRSQHKGEFSGYKGRGANTKAAWEAYKKAYGYK